MDSPWASSGPEASQAEGCLWALSRAPTPRKTALAGVNLLSNPGCLPHPTHDYRGSCQPGVPPFPVGGSGIPAVPGAAPVDLLLLISGTLAMVRNALFPKGVTWRSCTELYSWDWTQRKSLQGSTRMG